MRKGASVGGLVVRGNVALASLPPILAASVAAACALAGAPNRLALWVILGTFAALGVFFLLAAAAGLVRVGQSADDDWVGKAALGEMDVGLLVTNRHGDPIYANAHELAVAIGRALSGSRTLGGAGFHLPETSEALFRLTRAAARGDAHREHLSWNVGGAPRWIRVDTRPLRQPGASGENLPILWQITDLTAEQAHHAKALDGAKIAVARCDALPVGLLTATRDGAITYMNRTFARWLGATPELLLERDLRLDDLLSNDGTQIVAAWSGQPASAGVDLELAREDGGLLPVRLLARTTDQGHAIAVLNYEEDGARRDEGVAEARFARFFRSAPFGIATVGPDGRLVGANAAFSRMMLDGASGSGESALACLTAHAEADAQGPIEAGLNQVLAGRGKVAPIDVTFKDDRARRLYMSPAAGSRRSREAAVLYTIDSSEQKALEAKLAQSQKMEAVGKLAGGIAHDFNNVLTVIIGYSDLLLQKHRQTSPAYQEIMYIKSAANRAANLVGKLLAFSRQQTMQVEVIQLDEMLTDLSTTLLKRSIGETIDLEISAARDLWPVKADKTQLDQVIVNLVVNARDAMPDGGKISIRLSNVTERESLRLARSGLAAGEYVLIRVDDTGAGMAPEVMAKIFEPFFTTKGVGKGTGLGLSTVYGIVKQTGGFIFPESAPGKGATFRVYLPRHHEGDEDAPLPPPKPAKKDRHADLTGTGRILLVEDEDMVRGVTVYGLKSRGYEVLEAATGSEALEVLDRENGKIDLVISDVVMPEMDGPTLLKELRGKNPDLKIIFVSGYPNEAFKASLGENVQFAFLPKPFSLPELAAKVKEELGR